MKHLDPWGRFSRKHCPHSNLAGIYGDQIQQFNGYRLMCNDCLGLLNGPVTLAESRVYEAELYD